MAINSNRCGALALAAALIGATPVEAQDRFPTRPVRIIVNTAPGGLVDVTTRLVAQQMTEDLKQQVIVDNRAGADGTIGIRAAKVAPADGYILFSSAGTMAVQLAVKLDPGYDLIKDFTGVGSLGRSPFILAVGGGQPDKSVADLIARAKAKPGALSYSSAGLGTITHLGAGLYLQKVGLDLLHIPYKGNGAALPDVMGGRVDMIFEAPASSKGYLESGKLRALGVSSSTRMSVMPELPTLAEQGAPGFSFYVWMGLMAPAGTPAAVVQRLSDALRIAKAADLVKRRFAEGNIEDMDMAPGPFTAFVAGEVDVYAKLVKDLGIPKQ